MWEVNGLQLLIILDNKEVRFKVICLIWKLSETIIKNYHTLLIEEETLKNV
jgi:hypothetical protein